MKQIIRLIVVFLFLISTAIASGDIEEPEQPQYVNFTILGAVVGPTKINGATWDATFRANSKTSGLLSDFVLPGSGELTSSAIQVISQVSKHGTAAPDVIGNVVQTGPTVRTLTNVAGIRMTLADKRRLTKDSYMPEFDTGYSGWPIYKDTRFRIQLWDKDAIRSDNIATVELTYDDIMLAIKRGKPVWINVADQSMKQLLYVEITATKALTNQSPKMEGYRW